MKRTLVLVAAAILAGCADSGSSSQGLPSTGSDTLSCGIPSRESFNADTEMDGKNDEALINNKIDISTYQNFIVKFKSETTEGAQPSGTPVREYTVRGVTFKNLANDNSYTFELGDKSAADRKAIIDELRADANVQYIEPDYPVYTIGADEDSEIMTGDDITATTNDTYYSSQWMHKNVQSEKAWGITTGSKNVVVAVLDSGIDYTHNDLKNNMWMNPQETVNGKDDDNNGYVDDIYGWNFVSNNSNPKTNSSSNHGSHVAGIIGASGPNKLGVMGMAPNVKLMALRFIGDTGAGTTSGAIKGIDYAVSKNVFAINNSWGSGGTSQALKDAITRAEKAGVLFLVAAGNGTNGVGFSIDKTGWYPAAYTNSNILSVAATKSDDYLTAFSNFGLVKVDVAAPGYQIISTVSNQGYQKMSGTSMATPLVTGLAALVKAANPKLGYKDVINILRGTVDKTASLNGKVASGGRVNAYKAVTAAAANAAVPPGSKLEIPCQ